MSDLDTILNTYGLAAIFVVMLVKAIGVPVPVPADAVMLATSARVADNKLILWQAFAAILIALIVGGIIQYTLVRGPGRSILYRYGRYLGLTPARLDAAMERVQKGGVFSLGVALLTPGVRSVAVPASGLAGIRVSKFTASLALASASFLALHFFLGAIIATAISKLSEIIPLPIIVVSIVVLLVAGIGVWYVIRRRQRPEASRRECLQDALGAWHEATCPVCLALGATNRLQIQAHGH